MAVSMKELVNLRNKAVTDARSISDRDGVNGYTLSADEHGQVERLLAEATAHDEVIAAADRKAKRDAGLAALAARIDAPISRQSAPSLPGVSPVGAKGGDGASLTLSVHGKDHVLRPGTQEYDRAREGYKNAFGHYLRGTMPGDGEEYLGLMVGRDTKGGYLAPTTFVAELLKFLDDMVFMRSLATVLPPLSSAVSLGVPTWETDPGDADWTAEIPASDLTEDDTATLGKREFTPHLLTKAVRLGNKLMRASVLNVEQLLIERLGYKFGVTEEKAYLTGSGVGRPLGVYTASALGLPTSRDITAASSTTVVADDLIKCTMNLKEQYRSRSTWIFSRTLLQQLWLLKDSQNRPLWNPDLRTGVPDTIAGRPYVISEYNPATFTTGLYVAALGDWKAGYWIADAMDMEVQRINELHAYRNQTGFIARKETDGSVVMAEALTRLKLA